MFYQLLIPVLHVSSCTLRRANSRETSSLDLVEGGAAVWLKSLLALRELRERIPSKRTEAHARFFKDGARLPPSEAATVEPDIRMSP